MSNLSHIFASSPDDLLDQISWLNSLIAKTKAQNPHNPALKDWEKHQAALHRAWSYMHDTKIVHRENMLLKDQNQWLIERHQEIQAKLTEYETIIKLKAENRLDEVNELCTEIVTRGQYWKNIKAQQNKIHKEQPPKPQQS